VEFGVEIDEYRGVVRVPLWVFRLHYRSIPPRDLAGGKLKAGAMLKLENKADLDALHSGNIKESISLEYKASSSVDKRDDNKKIEMARDISAFANSDGGQIVYGMTEKDHEPAALDQGVDGKIYPELWFEQVLQQHVTPPIPGLRIRHVPLTKPMVAIVIDVPATKGDPHQVSDGRYYRRHNYNRLIMDHYEVREAFHRVSRPELLLTPSLHGESEHILGAPEKAQFRASSLYKFNLHFSLENRASAPASYTIITIGLSRKFEIERFGEFDAVGTITSEDGLTLNYARMQVGIPRYFPIFKGIKFPINEENTMRLGMNITPINDTFLLRCQVHSPGFESSDVWVITKRGRRLRLRPPRT